MIDQISAVRASGPQDSIEKDRSRKRMIVAAIRHRRAGTKVAGGSYQPVCVRASAMREAGGCDG
jgi:hypothetical protein